MSDVERRVEGRQDLQEQGMDISIRIREKDEIVGIADGRRDPFG